MDVAFSVSICNSIGCLAMFSTPGLIHILAYTQTFRTERRMCCKCFLSSLQKHFPLMTILFMVRHFTITIIIMLTLIIFIIISVIVSYLLAAFAGVTGVPIFILLSSLCAFSLFSRFPFCFVLFNLFGLFLYSGFWFALAFHFDNPFRLNFYRMQVGEYENVPLFYDAVCMCICVCVFVCALNLLSLWSFICWKNNNK